MTAPALSALPGGSNLLAAARHYAECGWPIFPVKPGDKVPLIAGGKGKGQDFAPLAEAARGRVGHAVLIGEDGPKIAAALAGAGIPVSAAPSMQAAIDAARAQARPGDVVLLSPACASFDMFDNYEHRGDVFKKLVGALD